MTLSLPPNELTHLLQQTLGSHIEIAETEVANQQRDYLVLLVQLRKPSLKVVVKLAGAKAQMASSFDRTAMLLQRVREGTRIHVPEVLALNMDFQTWPWRFLIQSYVPGEAFAKVRQQMGAEQLVSAYRQIGEAVAQLHNLGFPAFGELEAQGEVRGPGTFLPALHVHARRIIQDEQLYNLFGELLERRRELFEDVKGACLCHEDLHGYNILFAQDGGQWRLSTILDFDKAWAGQAEIDLARMDFWTGMTSREFWAAYQESHAIDPLYPQRRPIYQLLWCFEVAWNTPRHLADTQELCAELGVRFGGRFE